MKSAIILLFIIFSAAACATNMAENRNRAANSPPETPAPNTKQAVLIELFTSEGWSSCPAADRALATLEKQQPYPQAEIITLALHVDYWNYLGWKDEFSSPLFSERQQDYARRFKIPSVYTPQMIVDGRTEFVGGDSGKAARAITEAANFQKGKIEIIKNGDRLSVKISELPDHEAATVFLAIAESNLVSNVGRGENSGQRLEHQSVVRELQPIGALKAQEKSAEIETISAILENWKIENLKFVVFVQENDTRRILSAGQIAPTEK